MHVAEFPRSWKPKSGDRFRWKGESIEVIKVGLKSEECCLFIGFEENTDNYVAGLYMLTPPLSDLDGEVN